MQICSMAVEPDLEALNARIIDCFRCPRLVQWRESIAKEKRRSFEHEEYWGRPVPNFGDPSADLLIVGLAPAAHGGNRTGRVFTGDRSGDWLFRSLFKAGLANQAESFHASDGLQLKGVLITAVIHCAPPANKPLPVEIRNCSDYFLQTLQAKRWRAILCLGSIAWAHTLRALGSTPVPKFGHGNEARLEGGPLIVGSYHPSQQNTFTGKLTEPMLDEVVRTWRDASG